MAILCGFRFSLVATCLLQMRLLTLMMDRINGDINGDVVPLQPFTSTFREAELGGNDSQAVL